MLKLEVEMPANALKIFEESYLESFRNLSDRLESYEKISIRVSSKMPERPVKLDNNKARRGVYIRIPLSCLKSREKFETRLKEVINYLEARCSPDYLSRYTKTLRKKRLEKGKCSKCGRINRNTKYKWCETCRIVNRIKTSEPRFCKVCKQQVEARKHYCSDCSKKMQRLHTKNLREKYLSMSICIRCYKRKIVSGSKVYCKQCRDIQRIAASFYQHKKKDKDVLRS